MNHGMKKISYFIFHISYLLTSLCAIAFPLAAKEATTALKPNERLFAEGELFPGHVQGCAADESGIYWSCYDRIIKTDWQGKLLCKALTMRHSGDCALHDGKLYVATQIRDKAERAKAGCLGAVYVYDCKDLKMLRRYLLPETPGVDGIVRCGDLWYIGLNGRKKLYDENPICIFDQDFKLLRKVMLNTGTPATFGVQTLNLYQGKILASLYSKKPSWLLEKETLKVIAPFPRKCTFGFSVVPQSVSGKKDVFLVAIVAGKKGAYYLKGSFHYLDEKGKIQDFPAEKIKNIQ